MGPTEGLPSHGTVPAIEGTSHAGHAFDALQSGAAGDPGLGNQAELGVNTGSVSY